MLTSPTLGGMPHPWPLISSWASVQFLVFCQSGRELIAWLYEVGEWTRDLVSFIRISPHHLIFSNILYSLFWALWCLQFLRLFKALQYDLFNSCSHSVHEYLGFSLIVSVTAHLCVFHFWKKKFWCSSTHQLIVHWHHFAPANVLMF